MARALAIAAALGPTSAYTWLKVPVVPEPERMLEATTLPCLLLGGDPAARENRAGAAEWATALAQPQVHGIVAGRSALYPEDGDVAAAVRSLAALADQAAARTGGPGEREPSRQEETS
jgi:hypothetical protein